MLSQKGPTPLWDFPPSDLKMSKSPILDFRFDNNNQEILKMFSTIARSSSAPKLLKPKNTLLVIIERGKGEGPRKNWEKVQVLWICRGVGVFPSRVIRDEYRI